MSVNQGTGQKKNINNLQELVKSLSLEQNKVFRCYLAQSEDAKDFCNVIVQLPRRGEITLSNDSKLSRDRVCRIFFRNSSQAIQLTVLSSFTWNSQRLITKVPIS